MIIDSHVHTYKTVEIGRQAMQGHGKTDYSGTIGELLTVMRRSSIAYSAMVNMTPVLAMREAAIEGLPKETPARALAAAEQRQRVEMAGRLARRNEWTCAEAREHPELLACISVVPEMGTLEMLDEIEDKKAKGAAGLKLHPAEGAFYPGNLALWPVYRLCEELAIPVIAHAGSFSTLAESSHLKFFVPVLKAFPRLKLILAHLGRPRFDEARQIAAAFPNAYFDTACAITGIKGHDFVPEGEEARLVRELGVERVLFGSDFPWQDPERDIEFITGLDLSAGERAAVLGENAARLFDLAV